jgi:hypothetical protein
MYVGTGNGTFLQLWIETASVYQIFFLLKFYKTMGIPRGIWWYNIDTMIGLREEGCENGSWIELA